MGPNNLPDPQSVRRNLALAVTIAVVAALVVTSPGMLMLAVKGPEGISPVDATRATSGAAAATTRSQTAIAQRAAGTPKPTPTALPAWRGTDRLNILLLGVDQRSGGNSDGARTDTMIVLTLDPSTRSAGMLSIPRDLYVTLPNRVRNRMNLAHVYGGPSYAMRAVQATFGIPVQHYVRVNFDALTTLVDLVGGIDVYVDQDINDPTYPDFNYGYDPFVIGKGWHHMDGATALKYARTRHGSSDFFRMRRQQQVVMALRDRVLSTNAIPSMLQNAPQIMGTLTDAVATDLSLTEMAQLLMLAKDLPADRITRVVVSEGDALHTRTANGSFVLVPYPWRMRQLAGQLYALPPDGERVGLQNGTQTRGLASTAQAYLRGMGFNAAQAGDANSDYASSVILDYRGNSAFAQRLASALGLPATAISTTYSVNVRFDVMVILGDDYHPRPPP